MANEALDRISTLIDRVEEACQSERNAARGNLRPSCTFGLEEPIWWTHVRRFDFQRYFTDPVFYFEQQLLQKLWRWDNFPEDEAPIGRGITAWLGHYPEYTFLGMSLEFSQRGVPLLDTHHPMRESPDLGLLKPVDFKTSGWMPRIMKWYDDLRRIAAGRVEVGFGMTWGRGCLDLAMQLRGYTNLVLDTLDRPQFVHDLLNWLVEQRCRWYEAYYAHFGLQKGPVGIADDWLYVPYISPQMVGDFILPAYLQLEAFHGGLGGVHSCGNQVPIQKYLLQVKSIGSFEVSPWTDLLGTLRNVPPDKHVHRFLHPNDVLFQSPQEMEAQLRFTVDSCRGRSYSIGTSGLTPIADDIQGFIRKTNQWIAIAGKIAREETARSA